MTGYRDLVAAATIGVSRRRVDLDALPPELGFTADPEAAPAANLLDAAALFDGVRRVRAGRVSGATDRITARDETVPAIADGAAATLAQAIGERRTEVVAEALTLIEEQGLRLPWGLLPVVLDLACERSSLRPLVPPVLGERGLMLCSHNPRWGWAIPARVDPDDEEMWEHGNIGERVAWLEAVRTREPGPARVRLRQVWGAEPGGHRSALLGVLATELSMADEPWLEELLATPAIAPAARELLATLPESRLVDRAKRRVRASISIKRHPLRTVPELTFIPDRLENGLGSELLTADGLDTGGPLERLNNLVALLPSSSWPDLLGLDALALAGCKPVHLGEAAHLGPGLARVAIRERNAALAARLIHLFERLRDRHDLVNLVPMSGREGLIGWALGQVSHERVPPLLTGHTWSDVAALQVLRWLGARESAGLRTKIFRLCGRAMPAISRIDFATGLREVEHHTRLSPTERSLAFGAAVSIGLRRNFIHQLGHPGDRGAS